MLVVEDDQTLLGVMTRWLTRAGHEVVPFSEYNAAKRYLATNTPHVLIADVRLGAFNGLQLAILAKYEHPEIRAIILTGFDDPVLRRESSMAGADYLIKPVSAGEILDRIH